MAKSNPMDDLRAEMQHALHVEEILTWLGGHLPAWVDRLPTLPRWMGIMFWIYVAVALKAIVLLVLWLTVGLR